MNLTITLDPKIEKAFCNEIAKSGMTVSQGMAAILGARYHEGTVREHAHPKFEPKSKMRGKFESRLAIGDSVVYEKNKCVVAGVRFDSESVTYYLQVKIKGKGTCFLFVPSARLEESGNKITPKSRIIPAKKSAKKRKAA